jgi:hypothetical protein
MLRDEARTDWSVREPEVPKGRRVRFRVASIAAMGIETQLDGILEGHRAGDRQPGRDRADDERVCWSLPSRGINSASARGSGGAGSSVSGTAIPTASTSPAIGDPTFTPGNFTAIRTWAAGERVVSA